MKGKIRITVRISRYSREKELGEQYRAEQVAGETFTEWKKRKKREAKDENKQVLFKQ